MKRVPVSKTSRQGGKIFLPQDKIHYLKNILRLKVGDRLIAFDGEKEYLVEIERLTKTNGELKILEVKGESSSSFSIVLGQVIPKGKKMDLIVEKATELGVDKIFPLISSRSIPQYEAKKKKEKKSRWQKIAQAAAAQSGRVSIPEILEIAELKDALDKFSDHQKLIFWEEEKENSLKNVALAKKLFILIGPEGGFSKEEIVLAKTKGFKSVSLGQQILRTETASLSILSIIQYELGNL